jgi:hypothetical protein
MGRSTRSDDVFVALGMDMDAESSDSEVPYHVNTYCAYEARPEEETYRLEYLHSIPLPWIIVE